MKTKVDEAYSRLKDSARRRREQCLMLSKGDHCTCELCDVDLLYSEHNRMRMAYIKLQEELQQALGQALGYPRYCDDQQNFPGATGENGVCVGEHVAESLAMEAAARLRAATAKTMTGQELELVKLLGECYNKFVALPRHHPSECREFEAKIHDLQRQVMARVAERGHPEIFAPKDA